MSEQVTVGSTRPDGIALGFDAPLVARDAELERLLFILRNVNAGHGRLVVLAGEPGVGKTRLAREVLQHARTGGALVLQGSCFAEHSDVPFLPFATALRSAEAEVQPDGPDSWPELALIVPESGSVPSLDGRYTQLRLFQAATGLLIALAATRPVVLFLDDLHWADTTSLGLLLHLARHIQDARILILGTYRDVELGRHHPLHAALREAVRGRLLDDVHLRPLSLDGTAALLRTRARVKTVAYDLLALVHGRAQGNPFFTEELVAGFVEQGAVSVENEHLALDAQAELDVPQSIRSVVGERVGRLPADVQNLLRLASVIGAEFDLDILLSASGQSEEMVLDALDACLEARVLEELDKAASGRERYAFSHALIHQTLYDELPAHRRRRLHLQVSAAMEALQTVHANAAAELARHWLLGGDTTQAARYSVQAGDQASARYAHAEAVHHYSVALDVLRDDVGDAARTAAVQYRLASELVDLNRLAEAQTAFEASLATFSRLGDRAGQAHVHWGIARLLHARYDLADAVAHFDSALRLWPSDGSESDLVRLLADAARAAVHHDNPEAAKTLSERAQALAEQLGDPALLATALAMRVFEEPRPLLFKQAYDRAEILARSVRDWRTLTRVYLNRATVVSLTGDLEASIADRRRALEAAERAGETDRVAFAHQSVAVWYLLVGAWEQGRSAARTGLALDPEERLKGFPARAVLTWLEGRFEVALEELRVFTEGARQRGDEQGLNIGLELMAEFALQLDRPADAEAPAQELVEVARSGNSPRLGRGLGPLAETLVKLGEPQAEQNLVEALGLVDEFGLFLAKPALLRARGLLLMRQSKHEDALHSLQASAEVARSQHALIELGQTLAVLAVLARLRRDAVLTEKTNAERVSLVDYIGPEVRGLNWARDVRRSAHAPVIEAGAGGEDFAGPLSRREREVASLLVSGLSNRQIADALVISERTVENHVGSILAKLGVSSRGQVAVWAVQHGLGSVPTRSWQ